MDSRFCRSCHVLLLHLEPPNQQTIPPAWQLDQLPSSHLWNLHIHRVALQSRTVVNAQAPTTTTTTTMQWHLRPEEGKWVPAELALSSTQAARFRLIVLIVGDSPAPALADLIEALQQRMQAASILLYGALEKLGVRKLNSVFRRHYRIQKQIKKKTKTGSHTLLYVTPLQCNQATRKTLGEKTKELLAKHNDDDNTPTNNPHDLALSAHALLCYACSMLELEEFNPRAYFTPKQSCISRIPWRIQRPAPKKHGRPTNLLRSQRSADDKRKREEMEAEMDIQSLLGDFQQSLVTTHEEKQRIHWPQRDDILETTTIPEKRPKNIFHRRHPPSPS